MKKHSDATFKFEKIYDKNVFILVIYLLLAYAFFGTGKNLLDIPLASGDGWVDGLPFSVFSGTLSMWNPYLQGGTFAFKDIGFQSLYLPGILVMRVFPSVISFNLLMILHYTAAGFFTLLFLKKLGLNRVASFIGGLIFMFSGFLSAHQGHTAMFMAACYLPIVLYFVEAYMTSRKLYILFLAAVAFALSILADYLAVPMYIGMVVFPYITFRVLTGHELNSKPLHSKILAIIRYSLAIFGLGLMLAAIEIVPILESLKLITREKIPYEFFSSYSFPLSLLPILIFPLFYGITVPLYYQYAYFGPWNLTEMAGYMGILPLVFAAIAISLFRRKNRQIYFWTGIAVIAFILVLGDSTPLYRLMYYAPIYNMFRASARNWLEVNFAIAILAAFCVHYLSTHWDLKSRQYYKVVHWSAAVLMLIVVLILQFGKSLAEDPKVQALLLENSRTTSPAVYIPLVIILISVILLYMLYRYRKSIVYWIVVAVVLFFDLFSFGAFHNPTPPPYKILSKQPHPVADFLSAQPEGKAQYRILGLNAEDQDNHIYPDINMLYGFQAVNGYSNIWLKDFRNLTKFEGNGVSVMKYQLLHNSRILSSLSVKYIITSRPQEKEFLEQLLMGQELDMQKIMVNGFAEETWQFHSPARVKSKSITLKSKEGEVSLIQIPVEIRPKSFYTVIFRARMPKGIGSDFPLLVDLFGENYDGTNQEAYFEGPAQDFHTRANISDTFREYRVDFYSGENVPEMVALRFATLSTIPFEIKDIVFTQSSGIVPVFHQNKQPAVGSSPLYLKKFESPQGIAVYENMNFLPRARFVTEVIPVKDATEAIDVFWNEPSFNPAHTALVQDFSGNTTFDAAKIVNVEYSNNDAVHLSVKTGERSFLVLSDSWYPGWRAFIDGDEAIIYKTNAVSRGILIEGKGKHEIEFRFIPTSFYLGLGLAGLALLIMITGLITERIPRWPKQTFAFFLRLFQNLRDLTNRYPKLGAFIIFSVVLLYINLSPSQIVFYHDSLGYWSFSELFEREGDFAFSNFDFPLRGYLFPFLIYLINKSASFLGVPGMRAYETIMSVIYSAIITFIIPSLVFILFKKKVAFLQILLFCFLAIFFWKGSFFYPLTDLPAFLVVILGIYMILAFHRHWWAIILAGSFWGSAALLRPSYQVVLVPLLFWVIYHYRRELSLGVRLIALRVIFIMVGMVLVFLPQININWTNYRIFSPFAQTQLASAGVNLFAQLLGMGIDGQKYETNIGPGYPVASVVFFDLQGQDLLVRSGYKSLPINETYPLGPDQPLTIAKYVRLVLTYPLDFASIYFRHTFNGLDVRYNSVYVKDVYHDALLLRSINYSLWFLVIGFTVSMIGAQGLPPLSSRLFVPTILALPALLSIPAVVEVRFFLPVQFIAYSVVAFWAAPCFFEMPPHERKAMIIRFCFWYICFMILCFVLSADAYMGLQYKLNALNAT